MESPEDDVEETPEDFDPLLAQAERLPNFIKGSQGNSPGEHVRSVTDDEDEEEVLDDGFGYEPPDPSSFTAD